MPEDPEYAWITPGDYVYTGEFPKGCAGQLYRMHRRILDVPSYQHKCLVEALSGKDAGLWFCCSLHNFSIRYQPAPAPTSVEVEAELGRARG